MDCADADVLASLSAAAASAMAKLAAAQSDIAAKHASHQASVAAGVAQIPAALPVVPTTPVVNKCIEVWLPGTPGTPLTGLTASSPATQPQTPGTPSSAASEAQEPQQFPAELTENVQGHIQTRPPAFTSTQFPSHYKSFMDQAKAKLRCGAQIVQMFNQGPQSKREAFQLFMEAMSCLCCLVFVKSPNVIDIAT